MKKFLPIVIVLLSFQAFADNISYSLRIVEQNSQTPIADAYVRAIDLTEGKSQMVATNSLGYVSLELKADNRYRIDIGKHSKEEGVKYITYSYFLNGVEILKPTFKEIGLEKVKINSQVHLSNIYFDRGRTELNGNDKMALANTLIALKNSPQLTIEIAVRADCNESDDIAAMRYNAIKEYFATKGDLAKRVTVKNYGKENQLAGCNCNSPTVYPEEVYTLNRVAEFRVINF
ncbi:MAG: hypothetical protein KIS94_12595 [Chitinophagales bacterium]|nr:hypothetical protein [Chitinophagales bacterium]